jgi:hypothetical protein
MLCSIEEFKNALDKSITLFDDEVIQSKNLTPSEVEPIVRNVKLFLTTLKSQIESKKINTYQELISFLENLELSDRELIPLTGYLGKILDVIQLLKPNTTRSKNAKKYFINSLKRTGHDFLFNDLSQIQKEALFSEIINSAALYILLEVSNFAYSNSINPISSLRNSMGDRLPEEYFSELLAGWFIEDILIEKLKEKGFKISQTGVDTSRKILFKKPNNMGDADICIEYNTYKYSIELQRVGKATKPNKINTTKNKDIIKTSLKSHKITNNDTLTLLWFGDNPKGITESNSFLYNKLCMIKNSDVNNRDNKNIFFQNENIFIDKKYIEDNSFTNWQELKDSEIEAIASKFNMVS